MNKLRLLIVSVITSFTGILSLPLAAGAVTDYSLFGEASTASPGNSSPTAVQTVSNTTTPGADGYGGVDFEVPAGLTFADLTTLSTDFNVTDDNCGGGSPRFQLNTTGGSIWVYLGSSPSYDTCPTDTWVNSGDLLEGALFLDTSQIGGTFYDTYANALANYGSMPITGIQLVTDSGWNPVASGGDGEQTVLFDNVVINNTTYTFEAEIVEVPTNTSQCKKDGWKEFGGLFKNQGDCVSFVASGGRNQSSGLATY